MIDVSQSVEHEHPQSLEFLRKDCNNVVDFFRKHLGPERVFTVRELFEFVVKDTQTLQSELEVSEVDNKTNIIDDKAEKENDIESLLETYLKKAHEKIKNRPVQTAQMQVDDEVFKQVYIPQSLTEIVDVESQMKKMSNWEESDSQAYKSIIGIENLKLNVVEEEPEEEFAPSDSDEEGVSDGSSDDESYVFEDREPKGKKHEDKEMKKERKKLVRDEKIEKRKSKMPKSEKKRKVKVAADKKKK